MNKIMRTNSRSNYYNLTNEQTNVKHSRQRLFAHPVDPSHNCSSRGCRRVALQLLQFCFGLFFTSFAEENRMVILFL